MAGLHWLAFPAREGTRDLWLTLGPGSMFFPGLFSALDIFGGKTVAFADCVHWNRYGQLPSSETKS